MKLDKEMWQSVSTMLRASFLNRFDSKVLVPPCDELQNKLDIIHQGFYIGVCDSSQNKIARVGFLEKNCPNVLSSGQKVIKALYDDVVARSISPDSLPASTFYFTIVWEMIFNNNGLAWNEKEDGVYFSWGDRYSGIYLPYEIRRMRVTKSEVMNRLCSWEAHVPNNLWRLPEGLVFRLICDSYP